MRSPICRAVVRCHARRLFSLAAAAPVPALIVAAVAAVAPFALRGVGRRIGGELAGISNADEVATALVTGPMLAAAAAGAALTLSLPGRAALGAQLAAGPTGDAVAVVARLLVPACILVLTVVPSLAAVCVALAAELPGGPVAGAALLVATLAAVPAGAVVAEAGVALARNHGLPALGVAVTTVAWVALGRELGAAVLGPFALVADALHGPGAWSALPALGAASVVGLTLAPAWVALVASRPSARAKSATTGWRLVRAGPLAIPAAVGAVVTRRGEVRLAGLSAIGFGVAGLITASLAGAPAPGAFLLATTTAVLGSLLCPLVVGGALLAGNWIWQVGPAGRWSLAGVGCGVGLGGSIVPVAATGATAIVVSGAPGSTVAVVAALVIVGAAAALLAGALVPWAGEALGDQMTSFAALVGILIAMSLAAGLVGPRLVAAGLPDALVVALVCAAALGAAVPALVQRLGMED